MAEHETSKQHKQPDKEQKHRTKHQESSLSFDGVHDWSQEPIPLTETPYRPRMHEHAAMLSRIPFSAQRHEFMMQLNNTYGFRYVQRLMESVKVKAKLTVSEPNDIYEQEADRAADKVTRSIKSQAQRQVPDEEELQTQEEEELIQDKPLAQRQEEEEELQPKPLNSVQKQEEEEDVLQGKSLIQQQPEEEEEEGLQAKPDASQTGRVSDSIETRINSARGGGQPLADAIHEPMEQAFKADFSDVRVHTNSEADVLNKQLSAKAFTSGQDIFFRQGEYSPSTDIGQKLIAHELTHVVQQTAGRVSRSKSRTKVAKQSLLHRSIRDYLLQRRELTGDEFDEAKNRCLRSYVSTDPWRAKKAKELNLNDFIKYELKRGNIRSDDEDVEAIAEYLQNYTVAAEIPTQYDDVIDAMEPYTTKKQYVKFLKDMEWTTEYGVGGKKPAIVFGPTSSGAFYDTDTHVITLDPNLLALESEVEDTTKALDALMFECQNAQQRGKLRNALREGGAKTAMVEYVSDKRYVEGLMSIHKVSTIQSLVNKLAIPKEYLTEANYSDSKKNRRVERPDRSALPDQDKRQALWWWKTRSWSELQRMEVWMLENHAEGMGSSAEVYETQK